MSPKSPLYAGVDIFPMTFKTKIILAVTLAIAILLGGTAWLHFNFYRQEMTTSISRHQFTLVSALAEEIDQKVGTAQEYLRSLAANITPELIANDTARENFFAMVHNQHHFFDEGITLLAPDGTILTKPHNNNIHFKADCPTLDYYRFATLETGQPQISEPFSPTRENNPVVIFSAPVFNNNHEIVAILIGHLNLMHNNFLGHLSEVRLGEGGYLYLYNQARTLIVHPDRARIMQQDVSPGVNIMFDKALGGFEGTGETITSTGMHTLSSFKRLRTTNWILAANFPITEAFASIALAKKHFFTGLIVTLGLAALLVQLLMQRLLAPLSRLTDELYQFDGEHIPPPVTVQTTDEIGKLATAFNQMLTKLGRQESILKEQLHFLQVLIDSIPQPIFYKNADSRFLGCNRAFEDCLGVARQDLINKTAHDISPPELADRYAQADRELFAKGLGATQVYENALVFADNNSRDVIFFRATFPDLHGNLGGLVGTILDITERKKTEKELQKLSLAVQQSPVAVIITDVEGNIEYVNPKFSQITGYSFTEVLGKNPRILKSGSMSQQQYQELWQALNEGEEWHGDFHNQRKDGSLFWESASISPVCDADGVTHFVAVKEDISERKQHEQQLEKLATRDELTGLANRTLLFDRLEQAIRAARRDGNRFAVFLLDIDRFKIVNDSLGHDYGDMLLCDVAARLRATMRESDTVSRFGGDEFVILIKEIKSLEDVYQIATKILHVIAAPFQLERREFSLTASLGISIYPDDGTDKNTLIRNADIAMYQAKKLNNHFSCYSQEMNHQLIETLELENSLRQALKKNEFILYYQPKIDLKSGAINGCEALIRWQHPQHGLVSPGKFIPLAEETGLIVAIGEWALTEACRQSLAWQRAGQKPVPVAVNLSARQFRQGDLVVQVAQILEQSGLLPHLLELELTESMIMEDPEETEQTLHGLKSLGVCLSLDDFGTGYSSLNYLRRFPVDSLKIDRSFIQDVPADPSGASVVNSIINIAHNLSLTAIAEGVETREQLEFLNSCGCDSMQGYLFSKPLPPNDFFKLLQQQTTPARAFNLITSDAVEAPYDLVT